MQPNFDLTNRAGIMQAINWFAAQTQPDTVSNVLIAQINAAIMAIAPDLTNLTSLDKRRIKNAVESVKTGGFQFIQLPESYPVDTVDFEVLSSNLPPEIFTLDKNNSGIRYALGEAGYELKNVQELVGDGLVTGEYYYIGTFPSGGFLFGRNLGNVPAGTVLGEIPADFNNGGNPLRMYVYKQQFGADLEKYTANVTVTNNSTQNINFSIKQEAQYFSRKSLPIGVSTFNFYNLYSYSYFYFNPNEHFILTADLKIEVFVNGNSVGYNQWGSGTNFWLNNEQWVGQAYGLADGDTLEVVISDI